MYQGIVFLEAEYVNYWLIPEIFPDGAYNYAPELGFFYRMDFFDVVMIIDCLLFLANIIFLFIYLTLSLCPTNTMRLVLRLDVADIKKKDFLSADYYARVTIVQIFSFFLVCSGILFLINAD